MNKKWFKISILSCILIGYPISSYAYLPRHEFREIKQKFPCLINNKCSENEKKSILELIKNKEKQRDLSGKNSNEFDYNPSDYQSGSASTDDNSSALTAELINYLKATDSKLEAIRKILQDQYNHQLEQENKALEASSGQGNSIENSKNYLIRK